MKAVDWAAAHGLKVIVDLHGEFLPKIKHGINTSDQQRKVRLEVRTGDKNSQHILLESMLTPS